VKIIGLILLTTLTLFLPSLGKTNVPNALGLAQTNSPATQETALTIAQVKMELANKLYEKRKYKEAIEEYRKYLAQYPEDIEAAEAVQFNIAESLRLSEQDEEARKAFQEFCNQYSKGKLYPLAALRLGMLYSSAGQLEKAAHYYHETSLYADDQSSRLQALYLEATSLSKLKKVEPAIVIFRKLADNKEPHPFRTKASMLAGDLLAEMKKTDEASIYYKKVKSDESATSLQIEAAVKLGHVAFQNKNYVLASEEYRFARNQPGSKSWKQIASFYLLQSRYFQKDFAGVIELYETPNESYINEPDALLFTFHSAMALNSWEVASKMAEKFVEKYPNHASTPRIAYQKLVVLDSMGTPDTEKQAAAYYKRFPSNEFTFAARVLEARYAYLRKDYVQTAVLCEPLAANSPEKYRVNILRMLSESAFRVKNWPLAEKSYLALASATQEAQGISSALHWAGRARQEQKNIKGAMELYDKVATDYPKSTPHEESLRRAAFISAELNDSKGMRDRLLRFVVEYPKSSKWGEAQFYIGWTLIKDKMYQDAIPHLLKAREANPTLASTATYYLIFAFQGTKQLDALAREIILYDGMKQEKAISYTVLKWAAQAFYDQKQYGQAGNFFERTLKAGPTSEELKGTLFLCGKSWLLAEKWDDAQRTFEKYKALYMTNEDLVLANLELADVYLGAGNLAEAQKAAEKVLELQAEGDANGRARLALGRAHYQRKEYDEASKHFMRVAYIFSGSDAAPQALDWAARSFQALGNKTEEAKCREELKKKFPNYKSL